MKNPWSFRRITKYLGIQIICLVKQMAGRIIKVKRPTFETPRHWQFPWASLDDKCNLPGSCNTMVWLWECEHWPYSVISSVIYQYSIDVAFRSKTLDVIFKYRVNTFLSLFSNSWAKKFRQNSEIYFSNKRSYKIYRTCLRCLYIYIYIHIYMSKYELNCSPQCFYLFIFEFPCITSL